MSVFHGQENLQWTFPNVDMALMKYLYTAISNCSAERSFTDLKRIKSYVHSTMKKS